MGGPLSLARGPLSFIGTPSELFWSLALQGRTILSASGPFSITCVAHVDSILSNVRTSARRVRTFFVLADLYMLCVDLCPSLADRFHSSGPPSGSVWSLSLRVRTILSLAWHTWSVFYQTYGPLPAACGPFSFSRTFHLLRVDLCPSLADRFHSSGPPSGPFWSLALRVRTSLSLAWHTWSVFCQTHGPLPAACGPLSFSRTFYILCVDLCPSLADRFHSSRPRVDLSGHSRFACRPFSPPADLFLLLAWHTWSVFYRTYGPFSLSRTFYMLWVDLCPSLADRFNSSGPRVDFFGQSRFARGPFLLMRALRARTFCLSRADARRASCAYARCADTRGALRAPTRASRADLLPLARFARGRAARRRALRAGTFFPQGGGAAASPRPPPGPPLSAIITGLVWSHYSHSQPWY
jgi:hypothetical protein